MRRFRIFAIGLVLAAGVLEAAFTDSGTAKTEFYPGSFPLPRTITELEDGKILITGVVFREDFIGSVGISRFLADGSPDPHFGTKGNVEYGTPPRFSLPTSVIPLSNGKFILAMTIRGSEGDCQFTRFNEDGSVDTSFGTKGISVVDVNFGSDDFLLGALPNPDGSITFYGTITDDPNRSFFVGRMTDDGKLDMSFEGTGLVVSHAVPVTEYPVGVVRHQDGSFSLLISNPEFGLARLTPKGQLDTSFGKDGYQALPIAREDSHIALATDPQDRLYVGSYIEVQNDLDMRITRYSKDGTLDTSFGDMGIFQSDVLMGSNDGIQRILFDKAGHVLAAVAVGVRSGTKPEVCFIRLNEDGKEDRTFGVNGYAFASQNVPGAASYFFSPPVILDSNGKVLIMTVSQSGPGVKEIQFFVDRYRQDGSFE